jgi:membrane protein YqaA with SNARE-associated domain
MIGRWERFSSSSAGLAVMFAWALGEATVWPVIADALLAPMAAASRRPAALACASISGMTLGGVAACIYAYTWPRSAHAVLQRLPLTRTDQLGTAEARLLRHGAGALWLQPYSGIPMKVWSVAGGQARLHPVRAVPIFIASRALRMSLTAAIAHLLGARFHELLRRRFGLLSALYITGFVAIWLRMVRAR